MPTRQQRFPTRATAEPEFDPELLKAAMLIAQRSGRSWLPGGNRQPAGPVPNRYMENENAPSLTGLSPSGRFQDMLMRRRAMYQNAVPQGEVMQNGAPVALSAPQINQQQADADSGIGYGTNAQGQPIAVTPLGATVTTENTSAALPSTAFPINRTLNSRYGTGSSVDTGVAGPPGGIGLQMASGDTRYVPMNLWRTPQAQTLQDKESTIAKAGGTADDDADFQDMLNKLKKANTR